MKKEKTFSFLRPFFASQATNKETQKLLILVGIPQWRKHKLNFLFFSAHFFVVVTVVAVGIKCFLIINIVVEKPKKQNRKCITSSILYSMPKEH